MPNYWNSIKTHPENIYFLGYYKAKKQYAVLCFYDGEFRDYDRTVYHCPDYWQELKNPDNEINFKEPLGY